MRISDWSSDVCSSDLCAAAVISESITCAQPNRATLVTPTCALPVTNLAHARRVAGCHGERGNGKDFSMGFSLGTGFRAGPGARSACALGTHRGQIGRAHV